MFDFKNSTKNFNFKNSLEVFFSRTDWNSLIQEQTEILFNEQNFKHSVRNVFNNKLSQAIYVLAVIRFQTF